MNKIKRNLTLGIQTAELPNSIALIDENFSLFGQKELPMSGRSVESIKTELESILKTHKTSVDEISTVVVCLGPGSYTGLRGGIAFAIAFCQFTKRKLIGVDSFEILKRKALDKNFDDVMPILDAKGDRVFIYLQEFTVIKTSKLKGVVPEGSLLVGSGAVTYRSILKNKYKIGSGDINSLDAFTVAKIGQQKIKDKTFIQTDNNQLKPIYVLEPNITLTKNAEKMDFKGKN